MHFYEDFQRASWHDIPVHLGVISKRENMRTLANHIFILLLSVFWLSCDNNRYTDKEIDSNETTAAGDTSTDTGSTNANRLYPDTNREGDPTAWVVLNTVNNEMSAAATFTAMEGGKINFRLDVENFPPGEHAVHIHENGDCAASDYSSAGGHWNPTGENHGKRGVPPFHKGDIANMTVGDDGRGTLDMVIEGWALGGGQNSNILNKAIIVHTGADDFTSQPSGNAGDRIACGVIKLYNK